MLNCGGIFMKEEKLINELTILEYKQLLIDYVNFANCSVSIEECKKNNDFTHILYVKTKSSEISDLEILPYLGLSTGDEPVFAKISPFKIKIENNLIVFEYQITINEDDLY